MLPEIGNNSGWKGGIFIDAVGTCPPLRQVATLSILSPVPRGSKFGLGQASFLLYCMNHIQLWMEKRALSMPDASRSMIKPTHKAIQGYYSTP